MSLRMRLLRQGGMMSVGEETNVSKGIFSIPGNNSRSVGKQPPSSPHARTGPGDTCQDLLVAEDEMG